MATSSEPASRRSLESVRIAEQDREGAGLEVVLRSLRRRLKLIAFLTAACTAAALWYGQSITPTYTATATVVIDTAAARLAEGTAQAGERSADQRFVDTQVALLTSRGLASQVLEALGMAQDPEFEPASMPDQGGLIRRAHGMLSGILDTLPHASRVVPTDTLLPALVAEEPPSAPVEPAKPEPSATAIDVFVSRLGAFQVGNSLIVGISFTSPDPRKAAKIANTVAEHYLTSQVASKRRVASSAATWLEERLVEMREAVRAAEAAAAEFRARHNLFGVAGARFEDQRLANLQTQLIEIRAQEITHEAKLARAQALRSRGAAGVLGEDAAETLSSPFLSQLRLQRTNFMARRAELAQTFGARHPQILDLDAQLDELRAELGREVGRIVADMEDELARLRNRRLAVETDLAELQGTHSTERTLEVQLGELEREAETNRQLYASLLVRLKTMQEQEQTMIPDARIASRALVPTGPSNPPPFVFGMLGFTISLTLSGLLALLLERLDSWVRSAEDIEQRLHLPVVGVTPRLPRRKARNITRYLASRPFSAFAETGRMILTAMPARAPTQRGRIILVTSALPGDGKTTLAIMLAAAAARAGLRTVLVDLDIRRPALAERLTDERAPVGLVEFVKGEIPREQLIRVEPRTGFEFITTGRMPREPLELLRDHATLKLMEALRASHDLVVIDSSPLLAVADARLAAQFADQAVLAVRWSHVQIDAVEEALRGLYATGVDVAGCVLTRVDLRRYKLYGKGAASYYAKYKSYYSSSAQRA